MNTDLFVALLIPWLFWGVLTGVLIYAGRSWINMLIFPIGLTIIILAIGHFASIEKAFWASLITHLFMLAFFTGSYLSFFLKQRNKRD